MAECRRYPLLDNASILSYRVKYFRGSVLE